MTRSCSLVVVVLVTITCCWAFDNQALVPEEVSLTQILSSLSLSVGAEAGQQYHQALTAEELLVKMRAQLQSDQSADQVATNVVLARVTADMTALQTALGNHQEMRVAQEEATNKQQVAYTQTQTQLGSTNETMQGVKVSLATATKQCQALKQNHDDRAVTSAADRSTVSKLQARLETVLCSDLSAFIQQLALPSTAISLLEVEGMPCDCNLLLQVGADGMSEGCNCGQDSTGEVVEQTCEVRKDNVRQLLRSLLESVVDAAAQETRTFEESYEACYADVAAQDQSVKRLTAIIAGLTVDLGRLQDTLPRLLSTLKDTDIAIQATNDALIAATKRRQRTFERFTDRSNQRTEQNALLNQILYALSTLTQSNYVSHFLVLAEGCPHLCSHHGICLNRSCACEPNWVGEDCSISHQDTKCPFSPESEPCQSDACNNEVVDFTRLPKDSSCSASVCDYCRGSADPACLQAPFPLMCAERDRHMNCSRLTCPTTTEDCGLNRIATRPFKGCCFNKILDCQDKCSEVSCPATPAECPVGLAVRHPYRDCCFNATVDCVDECALAGCSEEPPTCPVGQQVRRPFVHCCFNATTDCEDECTTVICPHSSLPTDECRARGKRWTGANVGCCFDADIDCVSGDDPGQQDERTALKALFRATNGDHWYRSKEDTKWDSDSWICFWSGVQCSGNPGNMRVDALILTAGGLTGVIPTEIQLLKHLTSLDLSENFLEGPIPGEVARLSNLQTLRLRQNRLSGSIPQGMNNMTNIEIVDFADNFLTGQLPESLQNGQKVVTCGMNCVCGSECAPFREVDGPHNVVGRECQSTC